MINHSRYLMLEFLYEYACLPIDQMSLVLINRQYPEYFDKIFNKAGKILTLHAKGIRVFSKEYANDVLEDTIINIVINQRDNLTITRAEIDFNILDPYYLKDLRNIAFQYLKVYPIFDQDCLLGFTLFYANQDFDSIQIKNTRLQKLADAIVDDEITSYHMTVSKTIAQEYSDYVVQKSDNEFVLSPALQKSTKLTCLYQGSSDTLIKILATFNYQLTKQTIVCEKRLLAFSKVKLDATKETILAYNNITNHDLVDDFTLLYFKYLGLKEKELPDHIKYVMEKIKDLLITSQTTSCHYSLYKVTEESFAIFIPSKINKHTLDIVRRNIKDYRFLHVRSGNDISSKADLKPLIDFLEIVEEDEFNKDYYLYYRKRKSEYEFNKLKISEKSYRVTSRLIFNSKSMTPVGRMISLLEVSDYTSNLLAEYQDKVLESIIKNDECSGVYAFIEFATLRRRQTWEYLKKIIVKSGNNAHIILYCNNELIDDAIINIEKIKRLGFKVFCESSMLFDTNMMSYITYFDGAYFKKEDTSQYIKWQPTLIRDIINNLLSQNMDIILDINREAIKLFEHNRINMVCD